MLRPPYSPVCPAPDDQLVMPPELTIAHSSTTRILSAHKIAAGWCEITTSVRVWRKSSNR